MNFKQVVGAAMIAVPVLTLLACGLALKAYESGWRATLILVGFTAAILVWCGIAVYLMD